MPITNSHIKRFYYKTTLIPSQHPKYLILRCKPTIKKFKQNESRDLE